MWNKENVKLALNIQIKMKIQIEMKFKNNAPSETWKLSKLRPANHHQPTRRQ